MGGAGSSQSPPAPAPAWCLPAATSLGGSSVQPTAPMSELVLLRGSPLPQPPPTSTSGLPDLVLLPLICLKPPHLPVGEAKPSAVSEAPGFSPTAAQQKDTPPRKVVIPTVYPTNVSLGLCPNLGALRCCCRAGRQPRPEHSARSTEDPVAVWLGWGDASCGLDLQTPADGSATCSSVAQKPIQEM